MKILLVEPNYKNKYPPMGLMKISTYHKAKGDFVLFVKGKNQTIAAEIWDRVYITTLFTFDYKISIDTIRYYKKSVKHTNEIYVGGIMASLMAGQIQKDANIQNVIVGQLTSSSMLGFNDDENIDILPLDYNILDDVDYKYPAGDNYFAYTTRGCPNKCKFCAVPILEPCFNTTNHIKETIEYTDRMFGAKRGLLLLDNNVLNSTDLQKIVDDIKSIGFTKDNPYFEPVLFNIYYEKVKTNPDNNNLLEKLLNYLAYFNKYLPKGNCRAEYQLLVGKILDSADPFDAITRNKVELDYYFDKYRDKRPKTRFVDFNQGIDARLLDDQKMKILSELPIRPLRIAFDSLKQKENYIRSIKLAHKYGIKNLSNYILYNYDDKPEELWERLNINIQLNEELGISIFSFPMKYAPINKTTRDHVGKYWNKKYLNSITAILLVTKGIVAAGSSFFYKAFGKTLSEYFKILAMPRDFIIYRKEFEKTGFTSAWERYYSMLDENDLKSLLEIIENPNAPSTITGISSALNEILPFYKIQYKDIVKPNNSLELNFSDEKKSIEEG